MQTVTEKIIRQTLETAALSNKGKEKTPAANVMNGKTARTSLQLGGKKLDFRRTRLQRDLLKGRHLHTRCRLSRCLPRSRQLSRLFRDTTYVALYLRYGLRLLSQQCLGSAKGANT